MSVDIKKLIIDNQNRWYGMRLDQERIDTFNSIAKRLCASENKVRFQAVTSRLTKMGMQPVPWWFIAIVAEREYGGPPHWDKQLGQGDPLNQKSHNEPAGMGPYLDHPGDVPGNNAWTRCALEALIDCAPHAAHWPNWSTGGTMTMFEEYNGLGYAMRGVPSAYVWSGTDQYTSGKYVADHDYRAGVKDVQEGCAPILKQMIAIDKTIAFPGTLMANPSVAPIIVTPRAPVSAKKGLVQIFLDEFHKL